MEETIHSASANSFYRAYIFRKIYPLAILIFFINVLHSTSSFACPTPTTTFPIFEDFEANAFANWTHDSSDDFDWRTHTGATTSTSTGPSGAYSGTYYAYTESTSPNNPNKISNLISPCFSVQAGYATSLKFAYHMYGSGMGSFGVDITTNDGTSWTNLWSMSGDQGDNWLNHSISLAGYEGQDVKLRFNVVTGTHQSDVSIDDVEITSVPGCLISNPFPGFPIDFLNDNTGWLDYDLGGNSVIEDNGDGTMTISSSIVNGTPVDFGGGISGTSCGGNDGWDLVLNLSDRMGWTEFQAAGGSANLNGSCGGSETDLDYWDVTGTLTGLGCNAGRTITITGPKSPYRFQLGNGGNSGDNTCAFGMSTWFDLNEGGTAYNADIYAFMDASCYEDIYECIDCEAHWIESECAEVGANWDVVADVTASNGSYVTIQSGNNSTGSAPTGVDDRVTFNVTIEEAGDYNIFGRVQGATSDDDSFWVRANGGTWYKWNSITQFAPSSWEWGQVYDSDNGNALLSFPLTVGSNTIDFAYREDGALLDKIMVGKSSMAPIGIGEADESCVEICGNGIDDDGDTFIDCADSDCPGVSVDAGEDQSICDCVNYSPTDVGNPFFSTFGFNAFIRNNITVSGGESEGGIAMGGDFEISGNFNVAIQTSSSFIAPGDPNNTALLINGRIIYSNSGQVNVNQGGYVKLGDPIGSNIIDEDQNGNSVNLRITPGTYDSSPLINSQIQQPASSVVESGLIDFEGVFAEYISTSNLLASQTENATINGSGQITLQTGQANYLYLTEAEFDAINTFTFNPSPSTNTPLIINVIDEGTLSFSPPNFSGLQGSDGRFIILNFPNATLINLTGSTIIGSVFAPNATLNKQSPGNIDGQVVAKDYIHGSGEIHFQSFLSTVVPVGNNECLDSGREVTISVTTDGDSYEWSNGDITQSITVNPVYTSNYTVTVTNSSGCTGTDEVEVEVIPDCAGSSGCNLLSNSELDNSTNGWSLENTSPAASILSIDNTSQLSGTNSAFIDITNSTGTNWHTQFKASNAHSIDVSKTYNISFEAKATANKVINISMQQNVSPYTTYYNSSNITITPTAQTYSIPNISVSNTVNDAVFRFLLGNDANDIWIDNIILEEVGCTFIAQCETCTGDNLFANPGFESGSFIGADVFVTGVNSDDLGSNWGTPSGLDGWSHGPLYWVETTKATEGNKVVYLNNASGGAVCQGQYYDLGDDFGQISTCSDYRLCFDWASFNRDFPTGRSTESRPALDLAWFDINGNDIGVSHQDLGTPTANQDWTNLTWTNVSYEFSLTGGLTPPANATSVRVNISEAGGYDNGALFDNTSLCVTSPCFAGFDSEKCYFISDGQTSGSDTQDTLYTFNYVTSAVAAIGPTGTYRIESMAMDTVNKKVYVATSDSFGLIDVSTGLFYTISADMGSLNGADGIENIDDADGMTFDHANNIIWATERRTLSTDADGAPNDLLFQIDPTTGLVVQNAFGSGIGYLVINTPENDLDDIAIAEDGTLYAISNFGASGNQSFGIIDKVTGAWNEIGDYGIEDVESLAFTATGQLMATTGKDGDQKDQLYTIDAGTGIATFVGSIEPGHDVEACDCISASFINLQIGDKVFADVDGNGIQGIEEPGVSGVVVNLLTGTGNPYLNSLGTAVSTTTDALGIYNFDELPEGQYIVEFVLPGGGASFTSQNSGSDDELDSDVNTSTGRSHVITLANSTNDMSIDAGLLNADVVVRDCSDAGDLFVADGSGNIKMFNPSTGNFIDDFIQGLNGPIDMVVGSDDWLYVSNRFENEVRKYSLVTGVLIETITGILDDPQGMTVGPDGNIYVNNDDQDEVVKLTVLDGSTSVFVTSGAGGLDGNKGGIEFGPDGNLYVTSFYTDEVLRYNGTTGAFLDVFVAANTSYINAPSDLTFGPDGNLYVTGQYNDKVCQYNGTTGAYMSDFVTYQSGGLQDPVHLEFGDDGFLYVSSQSNSIGVLRYNGNSGSSNGTFATPTAPEGILFAPVPGCAGPCYNKITIDDVTVSSCIDHPLRDVATVTVEIKWNKAPSGEDIEVTIGNKTEVIDVSGGVSSPISITFNVIADGSTNNAITADWEITDGCEDAASFDSPSPCSTKEIGCDILYLCGLDKPYDGDAWDHGWIEYLDAVNGSNTITPILTKDEAGLGTYDVMNQNTYVNVDFTAYEIIVVSGTTEGHISADLVNFLKDAPNSILLSNYAIVDDFGLSSDAGSVLWGEDAYTDPSTLETIYNYDNPNSWSGKLFTKGNYSDDAIASIWGSATGEANTTDGIIFKNKASDPLTGISSSHGNRIFVGYHFNGIYANNTNNGVVPSPASSWFTPENHLTLIGKELFDKALIYAATDCIDEICDDGIDNDEDGLVDCADPECTLTDLEPGIISGDEIYCVPFTAGEILSYEDPSNSGDAYTIKWQQSSDNMNWNDIPGAVGLTYSPGSITTTTFYRRATAISLCSIELYSNVIRKVVDNNMPICIEDEEFDFPCETGYRISPAGSGIQGEANPAVRVLNSSFFDYYIVEATFKGGAGATDQVIFSTLEGDQQVVSKQYFEGESGQSGSRYFKALLPPSDSIFLSYNGDISLAESFVVYTVRSGEDFESFGKSVHQEIQPGEEYKVSFPLSASINHKAAYANINLAGIENDGTEIYISVYGDGASATDTIIEPSHGNTLNLQFINIEEILPDSDSLHIVIKSPAMNGQTALISGYVSVIVECDNKLVVTAETDADCVKVGDVITYNYTLYNFDDVEFDNLNATSSLGGDIDFGITTVPANSQHSASQDITITQAMVDNPPLVNDVFVYGWNFSVYGIKPKSDGIIDTLVICEICDDEIDNDGDGLIDCLDPNCDGDVDDLNPDQVICVGEVVQLQSSVPGSSWTSSNSNIAIVSSSGMATGIAEGSVTFTFTSSGGCESTTGILTVDNSVDVVIDFNGSLCLEDDSQLSAIPSGGTPDFTYSWTGPNGFSETTQTVDITENGNYNVTVTDSKGCSSNTTAFVYEQYEPFIFTLNSEVCEGEDVTLSVNGASGGTYQWDANAGNATSSSVTVTPSAPSSSYTVTVTNSIGCTTSATAVIDVIAKPTVAITGSDDICVGETTQLSPSSGGVWTSTDYSIANVSNTGLVTGLGNGSVTFTFKDDVSGCYSDPTESVTVNANTAVTISGDDQICMGENPTLTASVAGGAWSSNNTSVATIHSSTGVITPVASGNATITYISPTTDCYHDATYNINIYDTPTLSINGPSTICEGSITYLSASTNGTWTSSDETVAIISNTGEVTGVGPGSAAFSFVSVAGCPANLGTPITVIANPVIAITGPSDICINETTTLTPTSGGVWISSNNSIATVTSGGIVTGKSQGNASFTFIESTYGCVSENNITVSVNAPPNITAPSSNSLCIGETANITPSSGGTWASSNSAVATIANDGTITAVSAGSATFAFTNGLTGCTSSASTPVTVQPRPTTNFTGPTSICKDETTTIEPNTGGVWSSTDVSIATITNQGLITGVSPGSVKFIFTNTNSGCVSDSSNVLTVIQPTVVSVSGPTNICVGQTSSLSPNTGGTWTSSNTAIATVTNAGVVTGVSPGSVTFIFNDGTGCNSEPTEDILIDPNPIATYIGMSTICIGDVTSLSPSTGGTWTSSDVTVATITNSGVATAISAGSVTLTYTNTSTGCTASADSDLIVNAPPTISITGDDEICIGNNTYMSPTTGGAWISSNSSIASITSSGVVTGISAGDVTFTFIESASGCTSDDSAPITILPRPTVMIDGSNTICVGSTTTLSPSTGGVWTSDNTSVATVTNGGVVTGISQGLARFTFTSTEGCASNETAPVIVFDSPSVAIDGPSSICIGETVQMIPSTGGTWTSANPAVASIDNAGVVTALTSGSTTFTFTDSNTGCTSDPSEPLTVDPAPVPSLTGPSEICIGNTTNMTPSSGGVWTSLHPGIATIQNNGEIVGIGEGVAKFIFMNLATGCYSDTTSAITVLAGPDIMFNGPTEICLGDTTYILPSSGGTWESTNSSVASITDAGMIIGISAGNATFQFTETSSNCKSTLSEILTVNGAPTVGVVGPNIVCINSQTNLSPSTGGTWISSNPAVATVNNNGLVTGHSEGTAYFQFTDDYTGCITDGSLSIDVQASPQIEIIGSSTICLGYTTSLSPAIAGIWTSSNPALASVSNTGVVTGLAPGVVTFQFLDPVTGCISNGASDPITITNCTNHDFNVTIKDQVVYGDLNTNDKINGSVAYGGVIETISKPLASIGLLTVNTDGTYSFEGSKAGKYLYKVPVCLPPVMTGCEGTLLEFNVIENVYAQGNLVSNLEFTTTYSGVLSTDPGTMVIIDAIANDTCIYAGLCLIDESTLGIIGSPSNGTAIINGDHKIEYTPNADFAGLDTINYTVCLMDGITCNQSQEIVIVNHTSAINSTVANDDFYYTMREIAVSGNVMQNDFDPEGESIAVTPVGTALSPIAIPEGSYYINSSGDFTFTPNIDFEGTANIVYTLCDNASEQYCNQATIHLLVLNDLSLNIKVYLEGALMNNAGAETQAGVPLMRDDLRVSPFTGENYIPITDPYSISNDPFFSTEDQYTQVGPGLLSKNQLIADSLGVFGVNGDNAIVDWVHVEMRSKSDSTQVIATRSGLVQRDGDVVDLDGVSSLRFQGVFVDSFYVVVQHRSHLGVMSQIVSYEELIDFTAIDYPVYNYGTSYGNGFDYDGLSRKNSVVYGYSALWAGDFDSNGTIKFTNPNDDQNILFLGVLFSSPDFLINYDNAYGYLSSDFDMNSKSKYTNPNDDLNFLFSQILLYPLNSSFLSNFSSLVEQIPE